MFVNDDVVYQIFLWLPVSSLIRFKLVCRAWHALIGSYDFIEEHLHHHRNDPNLKNKNHYLVVGEDSSTSNSLISTDSFQVSNVCVQQDCFDLHEYLPLTNDDIVSYNGIICLNLIKRKGKHSICICNPATKKLRIFPPSPALGLVTERYSLQITMLGFGFDVETNDYKAVTICRNNHGNFEIVEVYSLSIDSWRSVTTTIPLRGYRRNPGVPFNNETCFFWYETDFASETVCCFNFSSRKFHSVSFPNAVNLSFNINAIVLDDKIACVFNTIHRQTQIWVFDGYGSANESWVKLYTIDPLPAIEWRVWVMWLSMNGNHLFFRKKEKGHMGGIRNVITGVTRRYNVVTKEVKYLSTTEIHKEPLVEYKESLLPVGKMKR